MPIHDSGEMYLESILVLLHEKGYVRSVDVGEYMGYSKPSVSRAMGILKNDGYVTVEKSGQILLTDSGREIAEKIYERHVVLSKALELLGVDEKTAADDACKIEHVISDESFSAVKNHINHMINSK